MTDPSPIDAKRFALMLGGKTPPVRRRPAGDFVEQRIDATTDGFGADLDFDALDTGRFAVVWCYFVKGKPHKYTGRFVAIEAHIRRKGFPAFAFVYYGNRSETGFWRFYNVPGLGVRALPRCGASDQAFRRLGNNDHFAITHTVKGAVVKAKRYRHLPQAFPRDFLYAALGETPST